jgi:hypothetical protein
LFSNIFLCLVGTESSKIGAKVIKKMLKSKSFVEKNEIKEKTSEYCGKLELKVVILQCF